MNRIPLFTTVTLTTLLAACAGPPPSPEPGMEVIYFARDGEMQRPGASPRQGNP